MASSEDPTPSSPRNRVLWRYGRGREVEFGRVAFFTDAVFAIAMTLLIVAIDAPELGGDQDQARALWRALSEMLPQFLSFFLAFLLLARYWMAHHEFFATLASVDRTLIGVNMVYLAFVAFLPFPTELVGLYEVNPASVVVFAFCLAAISGLETVLFVVAHRHGLMDRTLSAREYQVGVIQSSTPVALFVLSMPIAFWNPTVAMCSWFLSVPLGILTDRTAHVDSRAIMAPKDDGD